MALFFFNEAQDTKVSLKCTWAQRIQVLRPLISPIQRGCAAQGI